MSASVDQGSKAPPVQTGANGPVSGKEAIKDVDYDAYMRQHHQAANMSNPERYVPPSFYALPGFPYFGDPAWSNGGDPLSYLGYGQPNTEYMPGNAVFNAFDYSHGGLAWSSFPPTAEYAWGGAASNARKELHAGDTAATYDYYAVSPTHMYAAVNGDMDMDMRAIEHGLQAVGVSDESEIPQERNHASPDSGEARVTSNDQVAGSVNSASATNCNASAPPVKKPMSWASVASQPAKSPLQQQQQNLRVNRHPVPASAPVVSSSNTVSEASSWDKEESISGPDAGRGCRQPSGHVRQPQVMLQQQQQPWSVPRAARNAGQQHPVPMVNSESCVAPSDAVASAAAGIVAPAIPHPVLEKLKSSNLYNPANFDLNPKNPRFFIIKSYSEDDIHRSIKYNIWCSTDHGNKRLDAAFQERGGRGPVYLFFSVNGSGHFCGMAQMMSPVDYNSHSGVWTQDKWKGQFEVKWIYVKDVPNGQLRHIRLENNENKPVTNSRDTQEVPPEKGKQVLKIMHSFRHSTSIFDDFGHYEKKQEEDESKKRALPVGDY